MLRVDERYIFFFKGVLEQPVGLNLSGRGSSVTKRTLAELQAIHSKINDCYSVFHVPSKKKKLHLVPP